MFKVSYKNSRTTLISLLLTLNIFNFERVSIDNFEQVVLAEYVTVDLHNRNM